MRPKRSLWGERRINVDFQRARLRTTSGSLLPLFGHSILVLRERGNVKTKENGMTSRRYNLTSFEAGWALFQKLATCAYDDLSMKLCSSEELHHRHR